MSNKEIKEQLDHHIKCFQFKTVLDQDNITHLNKIFYYSGLLAGRLED